MWRVGAGPAALAGSGSSLGLGGQKGSTQLHEGLHAQGVRADQSVPWATEEGGTQLCGCQLLAKAQQAVSRTDRPLQEA